MGRFFKYLFLIIFLGLIALQFVKVERTNPPVTAEIKAPAEVQNIFKKSCYDCHSNETKWQWYSYVAPVSWFIIKDVEEGRKRLNFSGWEKLSAKKKFDLKKGIWEKINNGEMPMIIYTYTHPGSVIDITQKNIIKFWSTGNRVWD